jgi:hypothetical protein
VKEFWKSWGNLAVLLINLAFFGVALAMRAEMQDYIRAQLKDYLPLIRFEDYKAEHEKWGNERFREIQAQLVKADADRLRAESKLDRVIERASKP